MTEGVRPEIVEHANGILASLDMMDLVERDADMHNADEGVYLRHVGEQVRAKAAKMMAALDTHLVNVLEKPISWKGWLFRRGRKESVERFDHDEIAKRVRAFLLDEIVAQARGDVGNQFMEGYGAGLMDAIRVMRDLYISESTKAKLTQLDRYNIPRKLNADGSVRTAREGDRYIDVSPIMSERQE